MLAVPPVARYWEGPKFFEARAMFESLCDAVATPPTPTTSKTTGAPAAAAEAAAAAATAVASSDITTGESDQ